MLQFNPYSTAGNPEGGALILAADIEDSTDVGRALMTAASESAAQVAIGLGDWVGSTNITTVGILPLLQIGNGFRLVAVTGGAKIQVSNDGINWDETGTQFTT